MVKEIVKDLEFLKVPSRRATKLHKQAIQDLLDTANHYKDNCIGLAAVQVGYHINAIAILIDKKFIVLHNTTIVKSSNVKETAKEGCLSIPGEREVERSVTIVVLTQRRLGSNFEKLTFTGLAARVIQHELDHVKGVLV